MQQPQTFPHVPQNGPRVLWVSTKRHCGSSCGSVGGGLEVVPGPEIDHGRHLERPWMTLQSVPHRLRGEAAAARAAAGYRTVPHRQGQDVCGTYLQRDCVGKALHGVHHERREIRIVAAAARRRRRRERCSVVRG